MEWNGGLAVPSSVCEKTGGHELEQIAPHFTTWQASGHPSCEAKQGPPTQRPGRELMSDMWLQL